MLGKTTTIPPTCVKTTSFKEKREEMALVNFSQYSLKQLLDLEQDLTKAIRDRQVEQKKEALDKVRDIAAGLGITPEELILGEGRPKKGRVPAKYQNPINKKQTWSGRGKQPGWLKELLAGGKKIEELEIR
ncbi:MAG: H-NS histone family protein [Pseudomonadota bacterium]|nr:H-NS histone family protein [Pseudomonadota bacterium]